MSGDLGAAGAAELLPRAKASRLLQGVSVCFRLLSYRFCSLEPQFSTPGKKSIHFPFLRQKGSIAVQSHL